VINNIVTLGHPALRQEAARIEAPSPELTDLTTNLFDTLASAAGYGLSANQIGVLRRVAVLVVEQTRVVLINPEITAATGHSHGLEGCLSIPGIWARVHRHAEITVTTDTLEGGRDTHRFSGQLAIVAQHEIDHLLGMLFLARLPLMERDFLLAKYRKLQKRVQR